MAAASAGLHGKRANLGQEEPGRQSLPIEVHDRDSRGVTHRDQQLAMWRGAGDEVPPMRATCLALFLLVGSASDTLDDSTYRRLVDSFVTYDQSLAEGEFAPCYQTLTFCADGRVNANLEF